MEDVMMIQDIRGKSYEGNHRREQGKKRREENRKNPRPDCATQF